MISDQECFVYIMLPGETSFVTAGRFQITETPQGAPIGKFIYGRSYRERDNAIELDPVELRLQSGEFETALMNGFFGAIRDAMPDSWGRKVIERHVNLGQLSDMDYLMKAPDDRAGALGFGLNQQPAPPISKFNSTLELGRVQQTADAIVRDEPQNVDSAGQQVEDLLLLGGTSMGGARPKAVVEDDGALWVAKFAREDDTWNYPRVEHALLKLAKDCGLNSADSNVTLIGGRDVLLVRRFDRDPADNNLYYRHRMVSALTLLRTDDDAMNRRNWSYLMLADELRRVSAKPEEDLRELFGRVCFNSAVSNLDDHPRNHAVMAKNLSWRLSPTYDLTPSPVIAQDRRDLAMDCGLQGRIAARSNLISGCGRFLLSEEEAASIFEKVTKTIRQGWEVSLRSAGVSEQDCNRVSRAFNYEGLIY